MGIWRQRGFPTLHEWGELSGEDKDDFLNCLGIQCLTELNKSGHCYSGLTKLDSIAKARTE